MTINCWYGVLCTTQQKNPDTYLQLMETTSIPADKVLGQGRIWQVGGWRSADHVEEGFAGSRSVTTGR